MPLLLISWYKSTYSGNRRLEAYPGESHPLDLHWELQKTVLDSPFCFRWLLWAQSLRILILSVLPILFSSFLSGFLRIFTQGNILCCEGLSTDDTNLLPQQGSIDFLCKPSVWWCHLTAVISSFGWKSHQREHSFLLGILYWEHPLNTIKGLPWLISLHNLNTQFYIS